VAGWLEEGAAGAERLFPSECCLLSFDSDGF
jgi:hypothetical protein